jgi:hypothetical protein
VISNDEFLTAIFGARAGDAYVNIKAGDPNAPGTSWAGQQWKTVSASQRAIMAGVNTFFTISLFSGAYRRKEDFDECRVIMFDDVGTKLDLDKAEMFLPEPSYKLETSPGNFQWGYILAPAETDPARVTALQEAIIKLLSRDGKDPGMMGVTRIVRLPEGTNLKPKYGAGGFRHVLHTWNSELMFTTDDLGRACGWTPGTAKGRVGGVGPAPVIDPKSDKVFEWLLEWNEVYLDRTTGDGEGYRMECPWSADHTVSDALTGAYYPLTRGYKCHHGHCEGRGMRDIVAWATTRKSDELGKPVSPDFEPVDVQVAKPLVAGTPEAEFVEEFVFLRGQNQFYSLRSDALVEKSAVDLEWGARLESVLPQLSRSAQMRPSEWFQRQPGRKVADQLAYGPGKDRVFQDGAKSFVNTWQAPARYPFTVTDAEVESWMRLVRHIVGVEGPGIVEDWLDWCAFVIANPGVKPGWHIILQGPQGIGKDLLLKPLEWGVGSENFRSVNPLELSGTFNGWAEKRVCVIDEIRSYSQGTQTAGDQYNTLKRLTENTTSWLRINNKYAKEYNAKNICAFVITANDVKAVAMEQDDRRFLVVMAEVAVWAAQVYADLREWLDKAGSMLCAEWLWQRWDAMSTARRAAVLSRPPMTNGKRQMIRNTEGELVSWLREQVEHVWPDVITAADIQQAIASAIRTGLLTGNYTPQRWGPALKGLGGEKVYGDNVMRLRSGGVSRVWAVRNVSAYRDADLSSLQAALDLRPSVAGGAVADFSDTTEKVVSITKLQKSVSVISDETGTDTRTDTALNPSNALRN